MLHDEKALSSILAKASSLEISVDELTAYPIDNYFDFMLTYISGWPPSQGSQGSQGKVREFICCLKKVKNGQGIKQKDAAKSGKKDEIGKMRNTIREFAYCTSTTILKCMYIFHPMCHILVQENFCACDSISLFHIYFLIV